jgi:hypothetical protein
MNVTRLAVPRLMVMIVFMMVVMVVVMIVTASARIAVLMMMMRLGIDESGRKLVLDRDRHLARAVFVFDQ